MSTHIEFGKEPIATVHSKQIQSEMVERVAMALLKEHDREIGDGDYTDMARAAIEAMRNPTGDMCEAAGITQYSAGTYREMIDAALK